MTDTLRDGIVTYVMQQSLIIDTNKYIKLKPECRKLEQVDKWVKNTCFRFSVVNNRTIGLPIVLL